MNSCTCEHPQVNMCNMPGSPSAFCPHRLVLAVCELTMEGNTQNVLPVPASSACCTPALGGRCLRLSPFASMAVSLAVPLSPDFPLLLPVLSRVGALSAGPWFRSRQASSCNQQLILEIQGTQARRCLAPLTEDAQHLSRPPCPLGVLQPPGLSVTANWPMCVLGLHLATPLGSWV